jgi:hypothetical protein
MLRRASTRRDGAWHARTAWQGYAAGGEGLGGGLYGACMLVPAVTTARLVIKLLGPEHCGGAAARQQCAVQQSEATTLLHRGGGGQDGPSVGA